MKKMFMAIIVVLTFILCCPAPSFAELGDYGPLKTLKHLRKPPKADNPVTDSQRLPPYPLLNNPRRFRDGFDPKEYLKWQTVKLHPSTGAICGNGSPYKFFVNRVAHTSNTLFYFEGGGACWDYDSCVGNKGLDGARNPDGIPDDYMKIRNPESSLVSPFVFRANPFSRVKTQDWNIVFVPYCTGDIYSGDKVAIYEDPRGENEPLVWHHNGVKNSRAVVAWVKNNLQRPAQMLVTGCSAGGAGSLTNYAAIRGDIAPTKGYMINDSGPIYTAPAGGSEEMYPSIPLQNKIRQAWGLDSGPFQFVSNLLTGFEPSNAGTLPLALAEKFRNDRFGHTQFWQDLRYSLFSYGEFYDDTREAADQAQKDERIRERWYQDTNNLMEDFSTVSNYGYYLPHFRDFNKSHCATIVEFENSDIQEAGLEMEDFVNNVLEGQGAVLTSVEYDGEADQNKDFDFFYWLLNQLLDRG